MYDEVVCCNNNSSFNIVEREVNGSLGYYIISIGTRNNICIYKPKTTENPLNANRESEGLSKNLKFSLKT